MNDQPPKAIVIRPGRPAISPVTRWLGWLGMPWAIVVLFGGDALLGLIGLPTGARPIAVRALLILIALVPIALYVASPWLGRLRALAWLLATPQPEVTINPEGIRLTLPDRTTQNVPWSAVAELRPARDPRGSRDLLGVKGEVLANIPALLLNPRGRGLTSRSFAQQVVAMRPDRFALSGTNWAGLADQFVLRDPDDSARSSQDPVVRQRVVIGGLMVVLLGTGIVVAVAWLTSGN